MIRTSGMVITESFLAISPTDFKRHMLSHVTWSQLNRTPVGYPELVSTLQPQVRNNNQFTTILTLVSLEQWLYCIVMRMGIRYDYTKEHC
jgi:hypothetical protein